MGAVVGVMLMIGMPSRLLQGQMAELFAIAVCKNLPADLKELEQPVSTNAA